MEEGTTSSKIYVIARVYNLGHGDATEFDLYVDPESLRRQGGLRFDYERGSSWAVTPQWPEDDRQSRDSPSPTHLETPSRTSSSTRGTRGVSSDNDTALLIPTARKVMSSDQQLLEDELQSGMSNLNIATPPPYDTPLSQLVFRS